jgi:hypothetical protein
MEQSQMTPHELYEVLDNAGVDYEVVEIFDGIRLLRIEVDDETEGETE